LLYKDLQNFTEIDLHPDVNAGSGDRVTSTNTLIRRFDAKIMKGETS
jgi:hypothetical protein